MSKMNIRVHEANEIPQALKQIVNDALDYTISNGRCVTFNKVPNAPHHFITTLYDLEGKVLDSEDTTVYHAACYYRGTRSGILRNEGVEGLTFYRD
jgi:hypothetical protein